MKIRAITAAVAATVLLACAHAEDPVRIANGRMVDSQGFTLYSFDRDGKGKSNCNDACAAAWPPAEVPGGAKPTGDFSIVTREDGSKQWAFQGMPLYRFAGDKKPGDATGDKQGGVWHVVRGPAKRPQAPAGGPYGSPSMGY
jgi:predicted lipoprotein with Yx(FWY)xxD motif